MTCLSLWFSFSHNNTMEEIKVTVSALQELAQEE